MVKIANLTKIFSLNNFKNINRYLLIITVLLVILFTIIIVLYVNEKNTNVQYFLYNIYKRINSKTNGSIINPNYKVTEQNNIITVNDFLSKDYFEFIRKQFDNKVFESRDFMVRKATGVNFFNLHKENYNGLVELYYSNELLNTISDIIKKPVQRISLADPNACSLLIYANKGDHINWHYDYSSYYGDRFVVLLTIVNENSDKNDLSQNVFKYKYKNKINDLKMNENSLVIFKGSEILHKSTAIDDNERRILLSMVFCDICQEKKNVFNIIYEKTKNYILYGE
jgi:hypothetical protein